MPTGDLLRNPYVCGHPVSGDEFFGRRDELSRVLSQIERGGHYCVFGNPNVGKTSFLRALGQSDLGEEVVFCYCFLGKPVADRSIGEEIVRSLRGVLKERAQGSGGSSFASVLETVDRFDPEGTMRKAAGQAFGKLFSGLKQALEPHLSGPVKGPEGLSLLEKTLLNFKEKNLRPVLLLDDAEILFRPREDKNAYFQILDSLFNERLASFVLTLLPGLRNATDELPETLRLKLGVLSSNSAKDLFRSPAARQEVEFSQEWSERALSYVGRHPYLLQSYAFHLFSKVQDEPEPKRIEREVRDAAMAVLEGTSDNLSPAELEALEELREGRSLSCEEARLALIDAGVLDKEGQLVGIFADYFERHFKASRPQVSPPEMEPTGAATQLLDQPGERSLLEVIEERMRLDTYLRERFTQVATFVDIDVVGSTNLKNGEDEFSVIYSFEEFHKWQKALIEAGGGRLLNAIGDETMSMFDEPEQAVAVLKEMLARLPDFNREVNRLEGDFKFRGGVHLGEVIRDTKEERAYSHVLDLAGHLQKLAPEGSFAVSQLVFEALGQPEYLEPWKYAERDGIMTFRLKEQEL